MKLRFPGTRQRENNQKPKEIKMDITAATKATAIYQFRNGNFDRTEEDCVFTVKACGQPVQVITDYDCNIVKVEW